MGFTAAQQEAIKYDGHLLIVAGPGSGKTTTFIAKAQRILTDPRRNLLMTTFTREGADEMQRRLKVAFEKAGTPMPGNGRLVISTFHSVALKHLRKHNSNIKLIGPGQQSQLLSSCIKPYAPTSEDSQAIRQDFEKYMYAIDRSGLELHPATLNVIDRYTERLASYKQTDLYTVMRDCAIQVSNGTIPPLRLTDMLVDESQDTDALQKLWIFAHARAGTNTTLVGDDDQSIYEWRNALGFAGMKDFMDTFDAKRIELGDNFRCRSEILKPAVQMVEYNNQRLDKTLVAQRGKGGYITAINGGGHSRGSSFSLASFIKHSPDHHRNTVVLARQNHSLDMVELALHENGIKYKRLGKSIWDHEFVVSYMVFLESLLSGDSAGVMGMINHWRLDAEVSDELVRAFDGNAASFLDGAVPELQKAGKDTMNRLKDLSAMCAFWRSHLRGDGKRGGSVDLVVMGVAEAFMPLTKNPSFKHVLDLCSSYMIDTDETRPPRTLRERLRRNDSKKPEAEENVVLLMTMHGSKGLEFETVHIVDANKAEDGDGFDIEPERRLMYVALTRAKNHCFLWYDGQPHSTIREAQISTLHHVKDACRALNLPELVFPPPPKGQTAQKAA